MKAIRVPRSLLASTTAGLPPEARNETAVPSYCHPNPLIRWLFWQRLDAALRLAGLRAGDAVLDFGVGSGIILPTLHAVAGRVAATDLELTPARRLARAERLDTEFVPLERFTTWAAERAGSLACILALDVLEHVEEEDLVSLSACFRSLLRPGGRLVVSGPTESMMYRLGRRLAGFGGEYHHRSISDIRAALERLWTAEALSFVPRRPLPRAFVLARYAPRAS